MPNISSPNQVVVVPRNFHPALLAIRPVAHGYRHLPFRGDPGRSAPHFVRLERRL